MQKTSHSTPEYKNLPTWWESRLPDFLAEYGKKILYLIATCVLLFILMYRWNAGNKVSAIGDFLNADEQFHLFQESPSMDALSPTGAFSRLNAILGRRPELHAKFDGNIAQTWLVKEDVSQARAFANLNFERIAKDGIPFYTNYSQATLAIAQHEYERALQMALDLKQGMLENLSKQTASSAGEMLFGWNLLRIALLYQMIGQPEHELSAWKNWQTFLQGNDQPQPIYPLSTVNRQAFIRHFQEGNTSLSHYMKERERIIEGK